MIGGMWQQGKADWEAKLTADAVKARLKAESAGRCCECGGAK